MEATQNTTHNVVFFKSYYDAARLLGESERLALYDAVFSYAFYGEELPIKSAPPAVAVAFILIRPTLDSSISAYNSGRKGGRPKTKKEEGAESALSLEERKAMIDEIIAKGD